MNTRQINNFIRNTKKLSYDELKKEGDALYNQRIAEENALIFAVDEHRAIKPEQIERVKEIKEARNRAAAKAKQKEEKNSAKDSAE